MISKGEEVGEKCPHYSINENKTRACKVAVSRLEPDIVRETYFCKTNEFKSCLIYLGYKISAYKKAG